MAKPRNLLYVGGLENEVTEDILFAAFVPFGPLRSVQIPKDFKESKHNIVCPFYDVCEMSFGTDV